MKKKILFINPWNYGGMKHYSESLIKIIQNKKEYNLFYRTKFQLRYLFKVNPFAIHINSGHPFLILFYPLFFFYNSIITIHDAKSHEGESLLKVIYHKIHLLFIYLFINKIVVHSELIKQELPFYFKNKKIYIMPHVNYNLLSKNTSKVVKKDSKFNILFFGRILKYKGVDYLIKAFESLSSKKYRLTIAGEGKLPSNIKLIKHIDIKNKYISDKLMNELFIRSDVVVCPYISASQSGVIYASFAYNKPVIATKVGAITEVVKDKFNGILVEPKSSEKLKNAIKEISNPKLYNKLVNNIKNQEESSDNEILKKLEIIYSD